MSEIVERCCKVQWNDGLDTGWNNKWDELDEETKEIQRRRMRAAIAAMREPTQQMLDAAVSDKGHWSDASPETVFHNMIDAALK